MSSKCSLFVVLLFCNICFNGLDAQARPSTNLKLNELNDDVLFLIFDELDFEDLIYMSATNSKFNRIAETVFHQRYADYDIQIIGVREFYGSVRKFKEGLPYQKYIEIPESDFVEEVMKYAGKWIHKLTIQSHKMQNVKKVYEIVNKYTADCLPHLDLRWVKKESFDVDSFAKPFTALKELHFLVDEEQPSASMQPLSVIFPRLQRMSVSLGNDIEHNFLDDDFPNLEHLEASIVQDSEKQRLQFESLMRRNPQIRSLNTWNYPGDYVVTISKLLPALEILTLHEFDSLEEAVHFENVKNLQIVKTYPTDIEKLTFSKLELLDIDFASSYNELITFFGNHQYLPKLHLHVNGRSTNGKELVDTVSHVPNLVELKMIWAQHINPQFIAQIIESHDKLRSVEFSVNEWDMQFDEETRTEYKNFKRQHANDWHFKNLRNRIILEKKN